MDRKQLTRWLVDHRDAVHGDLDQVLDRCEQQVRRQAARDAWLAARDIAERRRAEWEQSFGFHASAAFVARELCHRFAEQLRALEPHVVDGDEERLAGGAIDADFEPEAREPVREWVHDLAVQAEHEAWREIVRFTDHRGKEIVKEDHLTDDLVWERTHSYAETAAQVAAHLARDYEEHARRPLRA